ncbi:hypothetical protein Pan241w_35620 [Gimesia alba]|uniref:Uncharacterized protein n=1 Tax=Gimesia alba TaxID=2527973 RepID=A0A517RHW1_9PLAN|nr:hypothetical protein Pan241w_35620 [Gimesia alba]
MPRHHFSCKKVLSDFRGDFLFQQSPTLKKVVDSVTNICDVPSISCVTWKMAIHHSHNSVYRISQLGTDDNSVLTSRHVSRRRCATDASHEKSESGQVAGQDLFDVLRHGPSHCDGMTRVMSLVFAEWFHTSDFEQTKETVSSETESMPSGRTGRGL